MKTFNIAVVPGDGIGPEVIRETIKVLDFAGEKFDFSMNYSYFNAGGIAIDEDGCPLPEATIKGCLESDSVLLGAVGGYKWDALPSDMRPENALLGLRKEMALFANFRPAVLFSQLADACPLKPELVANGLDILVLRELTSGLYFGKKARTATEGYDTLFYSAEQVEKIARVGFEAAMKRGKKLHSIDKQNVLESSRVWRETVLRVAKDYPEVTLLHMYVDNAAMQLVKNPSQFDVIVTGNMFGDILSDEAAMITGSIGMLPSASLGSGTRGMYEPVHGSAPDIAGKDIANPLATIMSAAMMLRYSFDMSDAADAIEAAVDAALETGARTADIAVQGETVLSTTQMTQTVIKSWR